MKLLFNRTQRHIINYHPSKFTEYKIWFNLLKFYRNLKRLLK